MATKKYFEPTIALVNQAKERFGFQPRKLLPALQEFVDRHFGPVWGTYANLRWADHARTYEWEIIFRDLSDVDGAEAYHDLTDEGWPRSICFLRTTRKAGDDPSVAASHELAEFLVNPRLNLVYQVGDRFIAGETADPVQGNWFTVRGLRMTNFVYPYYFDGDAPSGMKLDHLGVLRKPGSVAPGGYQSVLGPKGWIEVFGKRADRSRSSRRLAAIKAQGGKR